MKRAFVLFFVFLPFVSTTQELLGIMDLTAKQGVSKGDADILTDFVFDAVYRFGRGHYKIIARDQRKTLLKELEFAASDLCDDIECALEVGKYLAADYMIVGSFMKFGRKYYVSLWMVNVNTTEVEGSTRYDADDYDGIAQIVDDSVKELFSTVVIEDPPKPPDPKTETPDPKTETAATIAATTGMPTWLTITSIVLGIVGAIYGLIRLILY